MKIINPFDYGSEILKGVSDGALLTSMANGKLNTMSISWGMIGTEWNRPIFIAFVRTGRHTRTLIDSSGEFTVNIPYGIYQKQIIAHCGTISGRERDKFAELGLTPVESPNIITPGILELPLTLECKVVYNQLQRSSAMPEEIVSKFYPADKPSDFSGSNCDSHIAYYGEIVGAYIAE